VNFDVHDLLMAETRDAAGNRTTVEANDYRVLQPCLISDPNRNRTAIGFDGLGMVVGTAVMGKPLPAPVEGDSLEDFITDLTEAQVDALQNVAHPNATTQTLLKNATTRIVYDFNSFRRTQIANPADPTRWLPAYAATLARETHASDPRPPQGLKIQVSFSYFDGFGREIQKKIQAEPEKVGVGLPRWVGSGWTIFNNKGKPVRRYEPFFSTTHLYEFGVEIGVSPVQFYDPTERVIATLHPNHTYEKIVFDPWLQTTYDVNDVAAPRNAQTGDPRSDPDIRGYVEKYFKARRDDPWQTWYQQRQSGALGPYEEAAATKASSHADTPTTSHFDALGRPFLTLARNRVVSANHPLDGTEDAFSTRVELDIEGNMRVVRDANKKASNAEGDEVEDEFGRIAMRYAYDMLGNRICQFSMEGGARWMLNDVKGKVIREWNSRGHNFVTTYDGLRRQVEQYVRGTTAESDPRALNRDTLVDRIEYGEGQTNAERLNLRTRIYRHSDSAGVATNVARNPNSNQLEAYDFKGNLLRSARQLVSDYKVIPDWLLNPKLENETFVNSTRYDALNRPIQSIPPHSTLAGAKCNIIQPVFNEANLLGRVDVWLERAAEPIGGLDPTMNVPSLVGISSIDYDAKGQRRHIDYKNGASTSYEYDPLTFRLTRLLTKRDAVVFPDDCSQSVPTEWPGCQVQSLRYYYDPTGNVTSIQDEAQQTIFFKNQRVEPSNEYTYDALYRLIEATGREHLGQGSALTPHSYSDAGQVGCLSANAAGRFSPNDGNAMGTYIERYVYDSVGNVLEMQHRGRSDVQGWTRMYVYAETSLIEDGIHGTLLKTSNRLSSTKLNDNQAVERYEHDAHGNMVRMPHLGGALPGPNMHWDCRDQLRRVDLGGGGTAYYVYDGAGRRVRKVWEKAPGLTEQHIYFGSFEIFRRHRPPSGLEAATLERQTLHIVDDKQRIALVETRTLDIIGNDPAPTQLVRYQFGNHLGSATLELDDQAQIISYEEFTPFGSTTYQAVRSQTETAKRYRYTVKERDEESGLYYYGARYYAAWLGKWVACDPIGIKDGVNTYVYVQNRPSIANDPNGKWVNIAVGALIGGLGGAALAAWNAKPGERWAAAGKGALIGVAAGALAGATFGLSMAATGPAAVGGISAITGTTSGSVLISGTVAGAVGGATSAAANTIASGGTVQEAKEMASIGAFTGSIGGAVGAATGSVTSQLAKSAGASLLARQTAGGVIAGASSDVAVQSVLITGGVQDKFSSAQLLVSTAGGGVGGVINAKLTAAKGPGILGKQQTRDQLNAIAAELQRRGWTITGGGDRLPEEYLPGPGGGRKGSSHPDITATKDGKTLRVNTVDTLADGVTPTPREAKNAARIRSQTGDHLLLIPKKK